MNHILEQQKEWVINQCVIYPSNQTRSGKEVRLDPNYLATLITQTNQATIAEVVRIVRDVQKANDSNGRYNACEEIIEAITSNKE